MKNIFKKLNAKNATILGIVIIVGLAVSIGAVYGLGGHSGTSDDKSNPAAELTASQEQESSQASEETTKETKKETTEKKQETKAAAKETKKSAAKTSDSKKSSKAAPAAKDKKLYCKLTVSCKTAVGNSNLKDSKKSIVPSSGIIYSTKKVEFQKGDTVYDVLRRETKKSGIHMDSAKSPGYDTQYIKGIGNLYEFDCGDLSGWMYQVNGSFPHYGCSQYEVKNGDDIQWQYTCDLGEDIGGSNY